MKAGEMFKGEQMIENIMKQFDTVIRPNSDAIFFL